MDERFETEGRYVGRRQDWGRMATAATSDGDTGTRIGTGAIPCATEPGPAKWTVVRHFPLATKCVMVAMT